MSRRAYREKVFKLLFRAAFVEPSELEQQYAYFTEDELSRAESGDTDEDNEQALEAKQKSIDEVITTVRSIVEKLPEIDGKLDQRMDDWTTERIGRVELTLLRLAVYEIEMDEHVSTAVAINEAVELAKRFGQDKSPEFINGVLAKFA